MKASIFTEQRTDPDDPTSMWECWWKSEDGQMGTVFLTHVRPSQAVKAWMREDAEAGWAKREGEGA